MNRYRVILPPALAFALLTLAGCGHGWFQFAEREPWRREAELACLKSGQIREGAGLVRIQPIEGPGICGADFPLKVAMLGESNALGYSESFRPPGSIPGAGAPAAPRWQGNPVLTASPPYLPTQIRPLAGPGAPLSLNAPGIAPPPDSEDALARAQGPSYQPAPYDQRGAANSRARPMAPLPRLGPVAPQIAAIGPVAVKPAATLACPIVSVLDHWIVETVQPAAMRWFGTPVVEIRQISAYSCRGMNGKRNAHISEHAFGNALDIAAFKLADGRSISVKNGWKGLPEEQGFLRDVQAAACDRFTTVLAPGSNVYHYDHIHVDLMRRSRRRIICQPAAMSGEVVAARAAGRSYAGRDPGITGSIASQRRSTPLAPSNADDDWVEDESHIRDTER